MTDWISDFRVSLQNLRIKDQDFLVFGSKYHRYKFVPTVNATTLKALESRLEYELPEDYRRYVLEVSNGGVGPGLGLFALAGATERSDLTKDFPFNSRYNFGSQCEEAHTYDEILDGALVLSHHGCAMYSLLVVRGKLKGQVWYDGEDYVEPRSESFSTWLQDWASASLDQVGCGDG